MVAKIQDPLQRKRFFNRVGLASLIINLRIEALLHFESIFLNEMSSVTKSGISVYKLVSCIVTTSGDNRCDNKE